MLFYTQLQQMDGKWNDKWEIMERKWMKYMSISDGNMDNSTAQQVTLIFTQIYEGKSGVNAMFKGFITSYRAFTNIPMFLYPLQ